MRYSNFHSTLVRLRLKSIITLPRGRNCFHSTLVRLRRQSPPIISSRFTSFHSTLVRLRHTWRPDYYQTIKRFHSTLVRLRRIGIGWGESGIRRFPFHLGTIKTISIHKHNDPKTFVSIPPWYD